MNSIKGTGAPLDLFKTFFKSLDKLETKQEVRNHTRVGSIPWTLNPGRQTPDPIHWAQSSPSCDRVEANIDHACHQPPTKPQSPFFGAQVTFTVSGANLIVEAPGNKKGNFSSAPLCKAMFDIYLVMLHPLTA